MPKITHFGYKAVLMSFMFLLIFSNSIPADTSNCSYTFIQQTSGTTSTLYSVEAVNELICWTGGFNGVVRRTTDGGVTWLNANPNPGIIINDIDNIEAIDANNAWVATSQNTMTYIYKTTNGGVSWVQVYSSYQGYINGIHMTSETDGFAFGDPISSVWRILVTTNAGTNWTHLQTSPAGIPPAQGFRNSFHVSLPYIWFSSYPALIVRSTNSGINWSEHTVPGPGMSTILSIHFNSPSLGFASSINMAKSNDTGSSYQQHAVPGAGNINGIQGAGNEFFYIRGTSIYHSTDSGVSWELIHNAAYTQLDIDLPDGINGCLTGWSVGHGGSVIKISANTVGVSSNKNTLPDKYNLEQNYPNPFNPSTMISFSLPKAGNVSLVVYDILGREVAALVNEFTTAGNYTIDFNASSLSSGVYLYKIQAGDFTDTRKMVLVK
jgi:photosystem II stability/assembly factor-like uncharacterized protein